MKTLLMVSLLVFGFRAQAQQTKQPPAKTPVAPYTIPEEAVRQANPVKATPESIAHGKKWYGYDCAMCHGKDGDGKGEVGADMKFKVSDFTDPATLKDRTDGELFYIIKVGKGDMPPEGARVKTDELWDLVNYVRSLAKKKSSDDKAAQRGVNRRNDRGADMKNTKIPRISAAKRLLYALVGLLAGDLILLFFLLQHALHATILAGAPARTLPDAVEAYILYAIFSLVGWMLVGLPATLLFPARSITRLSWPRALIVGATVGPVALVVIFALLSRSHIYFRNFAEISTLFAYTILVSTVSFVVYLTLLRKEMKSNPARSQHFFHRA